MVVLLHWFIVFTSYGNVCHVILQDNSTWDFAADEQIMLWACQKPEDWQLGGKCEAYMWGGGRHGQLGEAGRNVLTPTHVPSFSAAQQVYNNNSMIKLKTKVSTVT